MQNDEHVARNREIRGENLFLAIQGKTRMADVLRRPPPTRACSARDVFIAWSHTLCKSTAGKLVSIDGKIVCGAFVGEDGSGTLHLVNA